MKSAARSEGKKTLMLRTASKLQIRKPQHNVRSRAFRRIVTRALGPNRKFSPHGLRHTFASLHLAFGTNLKWIQNMGGGPSAKLRLNLYGHFLPTESTSFADAIDGDKRHDTAPTRTAAGGRGIPKSKKRAEPCSSVAPRTGLDARACGQAGVESRGRPARFKT